jgi:hypothetical protein
MGWGETKPTAPDDEYGAVAGMRIDRRNRSTREKPGMVTLCIPQVPQAPNCYRTRATTMGSWRLTALAIAQTFLPYFFLTRLFHFLSLRFCYDAGEMGVDLEHTDKGKAPPVTGHGSSQICETWRLLHFLDNELTDDGEAVSLMRRPPFTPRKIPGTHFN